MNIFKTFDYKGNIKNPILNKIIIKERLFEENEYEHIHIYSS